VRKRPRPPTPALVLAAAALLGLVGSALAARPALTLPADLAPAERLLLAEVSEQASVATRADGEPFVTRRDVFEYLLDHPELAAHVTRALKLARYRIWRDAGGLWLDDGWGATGRFMVVYATRGTRMMYARGSYKTWFLPRINGQAVVVIEYAAQPAPDSRSLITTTVTGFVKLDSRVLEWAGRLAHAAATAKAEKEARLLVRVFARASRGIESDPAGVYALVAQHPDAPARDLEEFRELLKLP